MTSIGPTLLQLASATVLLALPVVIYRGVTNLMRHLADHVIYQVPVVTSLARLAGFLWAGVFLAGGLGEQAFRLSEIFIPDSVWAIPAGQLLVHQGNIWSYDMGAIARWVAAGDEPLATLAAILTILSAIGAALISLTMFSKRRHRWQALGVVAVTVVMTAWQSVYLSTLALWLIHGANFWSLAVVALYIQYRRSRHP